MFLFLQHDNSEALKSSLAMAANFEHQGIRKTVRKSDLKDGKLYLPFQFVQMLNPIVGIQEVTVRDGQMRSYTMRLCKRQGEDGRAYLGKGWPQFFQEKGIREGDTVTFSDLNRGDAEGRPSFKITHEVARRERPFDLNELPFNLNESPPPED